MVAIVRRTRELHALMRIRLGAGAAVLSPEVSRIHMELGADRFAGNAGAKQFWKKYLPRLKYHNPSIPMTVTRSEASPCQMTIHFTPPSTTPTSTTPTPPTSETKIETKTIPLLLRSRSEILTDVLALTKARKIEPTQQEEREMNEMNEELFAMNVLRKKNQILQAEMRRERDILKQALGGLGEEPKRGGRRRSNNAE